MQSTEGIQTNEAIALSKIQHSIALFFIASSGGLGESLS
jgi:hypothetical protein